MTGEKDRGADERKGKGGPQNSCCSLESWRGEKSETGKKRKKEKYRFLMKVRVELVLPQ